MILADWLLRVPTGAIICEVGAGRSLVGEQLTKNGHSVARLIITDQSARMLRHSHGFAEAGATLKVADAGNLPLDVGTVDSLIASLGDPYNTADFWAEAYRVLKPGGSIIFTVPAHNWAQCFRGRGSEKNFAEAEFELIDGRHVFLPSFIYPETEQRSIVEKAALTIQEIRQVTIEDLRSDKRSPKLCLERGPDGAVVTGYFIHKPLVERGRHQ